MKKHSMFVILLCAVLLFTCSCGVVNTEPKTFSKSGMTIELTNAFSEKEVVSYTATYQSMDIIVLALKEEFTLFGTDTMTLNEYAQLVLDANLLEAEIITEDSITYFEYAREVNGKNLSYLSCVYRGTDAYWLIQFSCDTSNYTKLKETMLQYAATVQV